MSDSESNSSGSKTSRITCEICGLSFKSNGEKEEHIKLEHVEHKAPSGVG